MMNRKVVKKAVIEAFENLGFIDIQDFSETDSIKDYLGIDSLDQVEIIMTMEERLDISVSDHDKNNGLTTDSWDTLRGIIDYFYRLVIEKEKSENPVFDVGDLVIPRGRKLGEDYHYGTSPVMTQWEEDCEEEPRPRKIIEKTLDEEQLIVDFDGDWYSYHQSELIHFEKVKKPMVKERIFDMKNLPVNTVVMTENGKVFVIGYPLDSLNEYTDVDFNYLHYTCIKLVIGQIIGNEFIKAEDMPDQPSYQPRVGDILEVEGDEDTSTWIVSAPGKNAIDPNTVHVYNTSIGEKTINANDVLKVKGNIYDL